MIGTSLGAQVDVRVVDPQSGEGRHEMLDGGDADAVLFEAG